MLGRTLTSVCLCTAAAVACGQSGTTSRRPHSAKARLGTAGGDVAVPVLAYAGHDPDGVPHYARRAYTVQERVLLRTVYGIEDPGRLYVSDSSADGMLKYDTRRKPCARCYVNSYRVGFASIRRAGESWEQLERRVARTPRSAFPESARHESTSLSTLDPAIQGDVERMLADAARAGFDVRVVATFRSPLAEAYVMRMHRGTHTLTSMHSYGRALDVVIGDGDLHRARTRAQWVAFRRWVASDNGGEFRILGKPDTTWDWGHIEVPSPNLGFHDIDAALTRARVCSAPSATLPCNFPLPGAPRVAMRR